MFRSVDDGETFAIGNVHVYYGDSVSDRLPEINALADYWDWLGEVYPDTPRMLVGDMNLGASHAGWQALRQRGAVQVIEDGATTLSSHNGRYANAYDHIWATPGRLSIRDSGKVRFPEVLGIDHETARATVSDHAPVWITLGDARLALTAFTGQVPVAMTTTAAANDASYGDCIDLNRSSVGELDELPHVGEARARAIIDGRPWQNPQGLTRIRGIGEARMNDILQSGLLCK